MDPLALERNDYARMAWFASVVPMMEITISSEVIFLTNNLVPSPDGNHAALLRASTEECDDLIWRVIEFYRERGLSPCVAVSPACQPVDLDRRLENHGFKRHGDPEHWLTLADPTGLDRARSAPGCQVSRIDADGLERFCQVMETAYEMPDGSRYVLEHFFSHINDLPGIHNYLAVLDDQPAGCLSLFHFNQVCALGSGGTLPGLRSLALGGALLEQARRDWNSAGRPVMVTQTVLPKLVQLLTRIGFQPAFTRQYYILE